jgi:serine/threonine protein kinase
MNQICVGNIRTEWYSYIVFPYCSKETLFDFVNKALTKRNKLKQPIITMNLVKYLLASLLKALHFLHKTNNKAHFDIKLENLVITDDY